MRYDFHYDSQSNWWEQPNCGFGYKQKHQPDGIFANLQSFSFYDIQEPLKLGAQVVSFMPSADGFCVVLNCKYWSQLLKGL